MKTNGINVAMESVEPRSFWLRFFAAKFASRSNMISSKSESACNGAPRKKILILDDNAVVLNTASLMLKSRGYAVVTATDGPAAIRAVRQEKPDLILLDLSLPPNVGDAAWDGLLIISWLRRLEEARRIPIIVTTGGDPVECKHPSLAAGAMAFFHKPLDHTDLLSMVARVVSDHAGG